MTNGQQTYSPSKRLARAERLKTIVAEAQAGRQLRIADLAAEFDVSTETIRRDLEQLSQDGLILRTLGGASMPGSPRDPEFDVRVQQNFPARQRAARVALGLLDDGDTLFLSSGITAVEIARQLPGLNLALTIVTTSYRVAQTLPTGGKLRVLMAPGNYDSTERLVSGPETSAFLARFRFDKVMFGASGVTESGVAESRSEVAWNLRAALAVGNQRILVADDSRFGQSAFERVALLSEIDILACNIPPSGALAEALAEAGVRVAVS